MVEDDEHLFEDILVMNMDPQSTTPLEIDLAQLLQAQREDETLKSIPGQFEDEHGFLRRRCPLTNCVQTLVPPAFRQQYLSLAHSSRPGAQSRTQQSPRRSLRAETNIPIARSIRLLERYEF